MAEVVKFDEQAFKVEFNVKHPSAVVPLSTPDEVLRALLYADKQVAHLTRLAEHARERNYSTDCRNYIARVQKAWNEQRAKVGLSPLYAKAIELGEARARADEIQRREREARRQAQEAARPAREDARPQGNQSSERGAARPVRPPKFSFGRFCEEHGLVSPARAASDLTAEGAKAAADQIYRSLEALPKDQDDYNKRLRSWIKAYKGMASRLSMSFGSEERKGPPASYLAKRAAKQAKDREIRSKMQTTGGKK